MQWWAHRGSGKGAVENTLYAMQVALNAGFRAVEFDVMLAACGAPMVHHDWKMGRCAKLDTDPDNAAAFHSLTALQLKNYTVAGHAVATFEDVMHFCIENGLQANVELKARNPADAIELGRAVLNTVKSVDQAAYATIKNEWVFSSFYHASLLPLRSHDLALLYDTLPDNWIVHADALGASAIHLHYCGATATAIRRIHTTGRKVRVYTVNDFKLANDLQTLGVSGIFTDRMDGVGEHIPSRKAL